MEQEDFDAMRLLLGCTETFAKAALMLVARSHITNDDIADLGVEVAPASFIFRLRRKLMARTGIEIVTTRGLGYALSPAGRDRLRSKLAAYKVEAA